MSTWNQIKTRLTSLIIPKYGRAIPTIARELFTSSIREKRFLIAVLYYIAFPMLILFIGASSPAIQSGTGIALFWSQTNTLGYIQAFYLSFFLGQILLVVLTADQLSGEIEQDTFPLLRSKPVYDSEIVLGKFLGMVGLVIVLDLPTIVIAYYSTMIKFGADFPLSFLQTADEVIGGVLLLLILQCLIIAFALMFSAIFSRNLYSILASILGLFTLSQISASLLSPNSNYVSIEWLYQVIITDIFYHIEPTYNPGLETLSILVGVIASILGLLVTTTMIIRNKELF